MPVARRKIDIVTREMMDISEREAAHATATDAWAAHTEIEQQIRELATAIGAAQADESDERLEAVCMEAKERVITIRDAVQNQSGATGSVSEQRYLRALAADLERVSTHIQQTIEEIYTRDQHPDLTESPDYGDTPAPKQPTPREGNMRRILSAIRACVADQAIAPPMMSSSAPKSGGHEIAESEPSLRGYVADQDLPAQRSRHDSSRGVWNSVRAYLADQEPSRT